MMALNTFLDLRLPAFLQRLASSWFMLHTIQTLGIVPSAENVVLWKGKV